MKIRVVMDRVVASKRFSRNSGTVVMPLRRYLGRKNKARNTSDRPAMTSQAMTAMPSLKAAPLSPTNCSVDRLVNRSEPAM